jgi:4,5-dihydroxyphthalate decarboxylase
MVGGREFDALELSASEYKYICRYAASDRQFIALPIFPSRAFQHKFIAVHDQMAKEPKDLNGKKVGV